MEDLFLIKACSGFMNSQNNLYRMHNHIVNIRREWNAKNILKTIKANYTNYKANYNELLHSFVLNLPNPIPKKIWMKNRSRHWFNSVFSKADDDVFIENFSMDTLAFLMLCEKLAASLAPHPLHVREAITIEMKVAIALYKLSSCAEYRVVGNQFGVHKSTVKKSVYQFCEAMVNIFLKEQIRMPDGEEAIQVIENFEAKSNMPQVIGAIDGTHIPITPTYHGCKDYINRKDWPSLVLQAVVDSNYIFRDIKCKHPGCTHDAVVLKDSFLYKSSNQIHLPMKEIDGVMLSAYVVGDPGYPLLPWLIRGYCGHKTAEQESFNVYLTKARIVVENAFGRLKARWRILQKRIEIDVKFFPMVVATCCILHNIVERRKVPMKEECNQNVAESARTFPQPERQDRFTFEGQDKREHLVRYMSSRYPLLISNVM